MTGTGIWATVKRLTRFAHSTSIEVESVNAEFATYSILCGGGGNMAGGLRLLRAKLEGNRSSRTLVWGEIPLKSPSLAITLGKTPSPVDGWMTTISSD